MEFTEPYMLCGPPLYIFLLVSDATPQVRAMLYVPKFSPECINILYLYVPSLTDKIYRLKALHL